MEHLYFWGVADKVRAVRLLPPEYPTSGITAYRNLMSDTGTRRRCARSSTAITSRSRSGCRNT